MAVSLLGFSLVKYQTTFVYRGEIRIFPYLGFVGKTPKTCDMQSITRVRKLPTIVGLYRIWILISKKLKTYVLQWNIQIPKRPTTVGSFHNLISVCKNQQPCDLTMGHPIGKLPTQMYAGSALKILLCKTLTYMPAAMGHPNTSSGYNCGLFPYLDFCC